MIAVSHLSKWFGAHLALNDISFTVQRGETLGVLGPNGAGKTTLMRILTAYLAATSGRVLIDGWDVFHHSLEVRRRIGYLPETAALYPELRVDEYLTFRAQLKGVTRRRLRVRLAEVKKLCGLTAVGRRIIGQLSRGYWQRVGLADSLIHDPDLLILDEPTMGLDPNQNRSLRELIRTLGRRYTILLATHQLAEAEMVCQRVLILNRGEIVAADAPAVLTGLLAGHSLVLAEILGPPAVVAQQLQQLAGVVRVTAEALSVAAPAEAWQRYQLVAHDEAAVRAAVFQLVSRQRWGLRELSVERRNLEDVFVQMTAPHREGP
ncbi:MAG: ATP-binding cassette domain-containing protein [Lentisphaerae bacterium]|nr:ATP-binding cassette domain-containing protein [Lentisphaerota bacterium]